MEIRTIGIDLGKTVFHFVAVNARGQIVGSQEGFTETHGCCALPRTLPQSA